MEAVLIFINRATHGSRVGQFGSEANETEVLPCPWIPLGNVHVLSSCSVSFVLGFVT